MPRGAERVQKHRTGEHLAVLVDRNQQNVFDAVACVCVRVYQQQMQHEIEATQQRIESLKLELEQAKRIRKHKEECEAVARVVRRFPPRSETQQLLTVANSEAEELRQRLADIEAQVDLRGKQFRVLVQAIKDLQRTLDEVRKMKRRNELVEDTLLTCNPLCGYVGRRGQGGCRACRRGGGGRGGGG